MWRGPASTRLAFREKGLEYDLKAEIAYIHGYILFPLHSLLSSKLARRPNGPYSAVEPKCLPLASSFRRSGLVLWATQSESQYTQEKVSQLLITRMADFGGRPAC
jgi:hypothetical protein